jgi:hypothetical protein
MNVPKKCYPAWYHLQSIPVQQVYDRSVEIWFCGEELHRPSGDEASVICES